ncbi:MAG: N-acetylmuramoyl-L-alanine amidase-like domain-containing protein [Pseudomonadota bacterium]
MTRRLVANAACIALLALGLGVEAAALGEPDPENSPVEEIGLEGALPGEEGPPCGEEGAPPCIEPWTLDIGALPPEVAAIARASRGLPMAERIGAVSAPFVGRPYEDGCAGEGEGADPDPPARYDVFDCLTFLEEVLALAMAPDPAWAGWYRTQLRFHDGAPRYEQRHHFFAAQWIRDNEEAGFIEDITASLGEVVWIDKQVTPSVWQHWKRRSWFALSDDQLPTEPLRLPVLPLERALEVVDRIPPGAIIVTVRIPIEHLPILVTHVGLTVPADRPTMRHATRMTGKRVRDDSLAWYIAHLKDYTRWPVAGINVLLPREQGPRLGALQAAPLAIDTTKPSAPEGHPAGG